jgi:Flp pilus assembly protein TadG
MAMLKRRLNRRQRQGIVVLMFGVMIVFVLMPVVGLAVDLGIAYTVKARVQSAADGAVIAAARSLGRAQSPAEREMVAEATAQRFFAANMLGGLVNMGTPTTDITFPAAPPKTTAVRLATAVQMPTYFLRILGTPTMTLRSISQASRRDVNIMLVIDRSGSLEMSGSCPALREAAKSFIDTFQEGRDKVGMVTYGSSYNVDQLLRNTFNSGSPSLVTKIDNIQCIGTTNSAAAYSLAYDQLKATNETGVLNAILFFTDGQPNSVTMPRLMMTGAGCMGTGNRFGVMAAFGGIYDAVAPTLPPIVQDPVMISNAAGCNFGNLAQASGEIRALTRAPADGNTGNDTGESGNSGDGDSSGHGSNRNDGHRWDNWPVDQDAFGNSLFYASYKSVTTDGSGRITLTETNITNAAINALANAATRIRNESDLSGLDVVTYVIGLGNFTGAPELELLNRVANSTDSPVYDESKPTGLMIYATDAGQLEAAFAAVASEMLRLAM